MRNALVFCFCCAVIFFTVFCLLWFGWVFEAPFQIGVGAICVATFLWFFYRLARGISNYSLAQIGALLGVLMFVAAVVYGMAML